jgi:hypothetical protein
MSFEIPKGVRIVATTPCGYPNQSPSSKLRKHLVQIFCIKSLNKAIMGQIPEEIVEKTWQEVAGFSPDRANKEMMKIGSSQPDLLTFVMESSKEMGREVRELAIYMLVVVYRMFKQAHGKVNKISSEEIIECYEHNEGVLERLEGAHERFLDRAASVQTSRQPYVVKYVADALMEDDEREEALALTEEQKGFLFLLLKTVIDVLDQRV